MPGGRKGITEIKDPRRHKSICTGGILRSNRERFLVMRYCKGRLKIGYFTHPAKMISQNKDYIFGN